ncbi:hypothetical protein BJF79_39170 [Actinomadura sp. CNU-125]|uniref:hypothetical protein n=1 Tax=Actinomadura sp. CNU-125 TaxID=1904961 RepID=UPI00095CAA83|nr:hypothetical protein [Actinomadura sp. CNU-125]OLT30293.1 hypothetical protein BJF79_39170 [Actinomadura sp. CNU-125]
MDEDEPDNDVPFLGVLLDGYPDDPPEDVLLGCADGLGNAPTWPDCGGWIMVLFAVRFYPPHNVIGSRAVLERLIEALATCRPNLTWPDGGCGHDEHPPDDEDGTELASFGALMTNAEGRAYYNRERTDDIGSFYDEWTLEQRICPAHLAHMADTTLDMFRETLKTQFAPLDLAHLDGVFLRPDGRVDPPRLLDAVVAREPAADHAGVWAARRWETGAGAPDDRALLLGALFHAVRSNVRGMHWNAYDEVRRALRTVAPFDGSCPHHEHPPATDPRNHLDALKALYEPGESSFTRGQWECPKHTAQLAATTLRRLAGWNETYTYDP